MENVQDVYNLQNDLKWLNVDAVKLSLCGHEKAKGYDAAKYEPMLNELIQLNQKGFNGIYTGDEQAIADAKQALEYKRAILLANPLLDADKIVAARFKVGLKRVRL